MIGFKVVMDNVRIYIEWKIIHDYYSAPKYVFQQCVHYAQASNTAKLINVV